MRAFAHCQRQTFPSSAEGQRALIRWLRKHKVGKAAMEASGGYERDWAKALREVGIEALSPEPLLNSKAIYGRRFFRQHRPTCEVRRRPLSPRYREHSRNRVRCDLSVCALVCGV
jgi:transposase